MLGYVTLSLGFLSFCYISFRLVFFALQTLRFLKFRYVTSTAPPGILWYFLF